MTDKCASNGEKEREQFTPEAALKAINKYFDTATDEELLADLREWFPEPQLTDFLSQLPDDPSGELKDHPK